MCSSSEAGSYLRLIDFVHHSTLGLRVIKKKRRRERYTESECDAQRERQWGGGGHGARPLMQTQVCVGGSEQWHQRHPEAGSSWPNWPKASQSDARVGNQDVGVRGAAGSRQPANAS